MGIFGGLDEFDDEIENKNSRRGGLGALILFILGACLFAPVFIVAILFSHVLFFRLKQRWYIAAISAVFLSLLVHIIAKFTGIYTKFFGAFTSFSVFTHKWAQIIPALLVLEVIVGLLIGSVVVGVRAVRLSKNPQDRLLEGSPTYNFTYARTPWQLWSRHKKVKALKNNELLYDNRIPIGIQEDNKDDSIVSVYDQEAQTHLLITGTIGSGKSETMKLMMSHDMEAGKPLVIIDFKASKSLVGYIAYRAKQTGRQFYHFTSGSSEDYDIANSLGNCYYDPLVNGGNAKADMLLGMREYDTAAAVYKSAMRQLLQVLFRMIAEMDASKCPNLDFEHGTLALVASIMADNNFNEAVLACEGTSIYADAVSVDAAMKSRNSMLKHAADELQGQMRTLFASGYGQWLKPQDNGRNINLYELTKPGQDNVILFSIAGDSEQDFAKYFGSLIFADLNALSALRRSRGDKNMLKTYADEFQSVPPTAVVGILEKARESRLSLTMSCQSMEQVVSSAETNGEAYLLSILDTISNFIIHSGATEDSATRMSKIIGQKDFTKYREGNVNKRFLLSINFFNRRRSGLQKYVERDWIVPPAYFMEISAPKEANNYYCQAVYMTKSCQDPKYADSKRAIARKLQVVLPTIALNDYYENPKHIDSDVVDQKINSAITLNPIDYPWQEVDGSCVVVSKDETLGIFPETGKWLGGAKLENGQTLSALLQQYNQSWGDYTYPVVLSSANLEFLCKTFNNQPFPILRGQIKDVATGFGAMVSKRGYIPLTFYPQEGNTANIWLAYLTAQQFVALKQATLEYTYHKVGYPLAYQSVDGAEFVEEFYLPACAELLQDVEGSPIGVCSQPELFTILGQIQALSSLFLRDAKQISQRLYSDSNIGKQVKEIFDKNHMTTPIILDTITADLSEAEQIAEEPSDWGFVEDDNSEPTELSINDMFDGNFTVQTMDTKKTSATQNKLSDDEIPDDLF